MSYDFGLTDCGLLWCSVCENTTTDVVDGMRWRPPTDDGELYAADADEFGDRFERVAMAGDTAGVADGLRATPEGPDPWRPPYAVPAAVRSDDLDAGAELAVRRAQGAVERATVAVRELHELAHADAVAGVSEEIEAEPLARWQADDLAAQEALRESDRVLTGEVLGDD